MSCKGIGFGSAIWLKTSGSVWQIRSVGKGISSIGSSPTEVDDAIGDNLAENEEDDAIDEAIVENDDDNDVEEETMADEV